MYYGCTKEKLMKAAFVNSLYFPNEIGGAEKAVRAIAEQFVIDGGEAVVICLAADGIAKIDYINGVKVYYVPLANIGFMHGKKPLKTWQKFIWYILDAYNPAMKSRVEKILRDEKPDILETNNLQGFSVSVWGAAKKLNIPVVQVLHDYYLSCINSTMYTRRKNCDRQCLHCKCFSMPRRILSDIPSIVSSVSRRTFERIHNCGIFPTKTPVVFSSSGIRLADILLNNEPKHHVAGETLIVGFLGRLEPLKGIEVLLSAFTKLPNGSFKLLIAGGGNSDYLTYLKQKYVSPDVEYLGIVQPNILFSQIHLLIVPSVWEDPLPRVIAESHASGIPVAISKIGGMPEIVEDGLTGYYFKSNDVESIVNLLTRLQKTDFPTAEQREKCRKSRDSFNVEDVFAHHKLMWKNALRK